MIPDLAAAIEARLDDPGVGHSWGYHSRISVEQRYVCMTVPKVGATTIKRTLREFEGLPEITDHGLLHEDSQQPRLATLNPTDASVGLTSTDWLRFAFVRNPYDRMFSAWKSKIANPGDMQYAKLRNDIREAFGYPAGAAGTTPVVAFADFVRFVVDSENPDVVFDGHWNLQTRVLVQDLIAYDVIGRFETFVDDLTGILRSLHAPERVLALASEVTNATTQLPLAVAYDRRLADLVYRYYLPDFEAFGYDSDSWTVG